MGKLNFNFRVFEFTYSKWSLLNGIELNVSCDFYEKKKIPVPQFFQNM